MSSEAEMRAVLLHAAEKLDAAKGATIICGEHAIDRKFLVPREAALAMGYAEGVLRLLATYLKYEDQPSRTNGQGPHMSPKLEEYGLETQAPRVPEGTGGSIGAKPAELSPAPSQSHTKAERNAAIVAAMREDGAVKRQVAERFGISPRRVTQIMEAAS
jgi:hypothetical protein